MKSTSRYIWVVYLIVFIGACNNKSDTKFGDEKKGLLVHVGDDYGIAKQLISKAGFETTVLRYGTFDKTVNFDIWKLDENDTEYLFITYKQHSGLITDIDFMKMKPPPRSGYDNVILERSFVQFDFKRKSGKEK